MKNTRRFPGGAEVIVVNKKQVLETIDTNIVDKEIALELVTRLEQKAIQHLNNNEWISIPYIGNIRIPKHLQYLHTPEEQEIFKEAYNNLPSAEFSDAAHKQKYRLKCRENFYKENKYNASVNINRNKEYFKYLVDRFGESRAIFTMGALSKLQICNDEHIEKCKLAYDFV